jgi:hypothetical protein
VFIENGTTGARLDLQRFLDALSEEVGNPTLIVTVAGLRLKLGSGADAVLAKMSAATGFVV